MTSHYKALLLTILSVISIELKAQNIQDGFIITEGDNYRYGSIQIDINTENDLCLFKASGKSEFKKYTPQTVLGYGVINGIVYITKSITNGSDTLKVFLKTESKASVKLYSYKNTRFFVERKNEFIELTSSNLNTVLAEKFSDCKNVRSAARSVKFSSKAIKDLFLRYERCTSVSTSSSEPGLKIRPEVMAGLELNTTSISFNNMKAYRSLDKKKLIDRTMLSAGVNAAFTFKNMERTSFLLGAFYYQQNFYLLNVSDTARDKLNFNYRELVIPTAIRFSIFKKEKRFMPYVKLELAIPVTTKSTLSWYNETEDDNGVYYKKYQLPQHYHQNIQYGVSLGTSFTIIGKVKNLIEINYQRTGGYITDFDPLYIHGHRINVLFGIRF